MSGRRSYATKTTINTNVSEDEFLSNVELARQLGNKLFFLEELESLYEKCTILVGKQVSAPPKIENLKEEELEDNIQQGGGADVEMEHMVDTDVIHPNFGEGSSTNPLPHAPKKSKKRKGKEKADSDSEFINTNGHSRDTNENNNNNNSNNINQNDNNNNLPSVKKQKTYKTRAGKKKPLHFEKKPEILDISLLRPPSAFPDLLSNPHHERAIRSLSYMTALANALRLRADRPTLSLPLSALAEKSNFYNYLKNNENGGNNNPETSKANLAIADNVRRRPFLSEKSIAKFKAQREAIADKFKLQDGDIIHMPFDLQEKIVAEATRNLVSSSDEWAKILFGLLPGRTLADCERFIQATNSGAGHSINEVIIYRAKTLEAKAKNVGKFLGQREFSSKLFRRPFTTQNEIRRRQLPLYQQVSLSPICSGATVDVKFDPTGQKEKLLVGCAKNDGATGFNFSVLYDVRTGISTVLDRHKETVNESQFTIDGERIITSGKECLLNVWNSNGEFLIDLVEATNLGKGWEPNRVAVHHSDPAIVASCAINSDTSVYVWRLGEELVGPDDITAVNLTATTELPSFLHEMDFSKGIYSHLLVGGTDIRSSTNKRKKLDESGWAVVFDIDTGTYIAHSIPHRGHQVSCVRTSPCGTSFITGSTDGIAVISDMRTLDTVRTCYTYQPDMTVVTYSRCGKFVTTSGEDNRVYVFDTRNTNKPLHILEHDLQPNKGDHDGVSATLWTNYGELLITGGEDNAVRVWDIRLGQPQIHVMKAHNAPVSTLSISRNDQLLASGGNDWHILTIVLKIQYL